MNRKFSAYREFAINAGYQVKKPQGRPRAEQKPVCADLRSPRYIFARCNSGIAAARFSATCRRSALADVYAVTDRGICETSGNSVSLLRMHRCTAALTALYCHTNDDDDDDCRESRVEAWPDNAESSPAVIECGLMKPQ